MARPNAFYRETELLVRALRGQKVLFLSHTRPDLDTLASGFALSRFFASIASTTHGCPDASAGKQVKHFGFTPKPIASLDEFEVVVCVDFRSPTQAGSLQDELKHFKGSIILLDHHLTSSNEFSGKPLKLIRPSSIATAQMVAQIGMELEAEFTPTLSTALAAAMITDSARFTIANTETFRVMDLLLTQSKKSYEQILALAVPNPPVFERVSSIDAIRKAELWSAGEYLIAKAHAPFHGGVVAHALVKLGADVGIGTSSTPAGIFCSIRISPAAQSELKFDAMRVLSPLAKKHAATLGGHATAAQINLPPYLSEELVIQALSRDLLQRARKTDKKAQLKKRS